MQGIGSSSEAVSGDGRSEAALNEFVFLGFKSEAAAKCKDTLLSFRTDGSEF